MAYLGGALRNARHTIEPNTILKSESMPVNARAIVISQVVVDGDTCIQSDLITRNVPGQMGMAYVEYHPSRPR
jgi:hypothetical protein